MRFWLAASFCSVCTVSVSPLEEVEEVRGRSMYVEERLTVRTSVCSGTNESARARRRS